MCGISGVASRSLSGYEKKIGEELLMVSAPRGTDSTGVFGVGYVKDRGYDVYWNRSVSTPQEFIDRGMYAGVAEGSKEASMRLLIAHNRAATVGKIDKANTHPFNTPSIIGVHNGTISRHIPGKDNYGTDSEALYRRINEVGLEEALLDLGQWQNGVAYALAFYLKKQRMFGLVSNGARTLTMAREKHGNTLYFASEHLMLDWILQRNRRKDVEYTHLHEKKHQIHLFDIETSKLAEVIDLQPKFPKPVYPVTTVYNREAGTPNRSFRTGGEFRNGRWTWANEAPELPFAPSSHPSDGWADWQEELRRHDALSRNSAFAQPTPASNYVEEGKKGTASADKTPSEIAPSEGVKEVPVEPGRPFRPGRVYVRRRDRTFTCLEWGSAPGLESVEASRASQPEPEDTPSVRKAPKGEPSSKKGERNKATEGTGGYFDHLEDPKFTPRITPIEGDADEYLRSLPDDEPIFKDQDGFLYTKEELDHVLASGCALTGITPELSEVLLGQDSNGYLLFAGSIVRYTGYPQYLGTDNPQLALSGTLH